ncbi:MAG: type II CAAX endopeptidase family protein [Rikenellaceae bacterium]
MSAESLNEVCQVDEPMVDNPEKCEEGGQTDNNEEPKRKKRRGVYPTFADLAAIFGVFVILQVIVALVAKLSISHIVPALDPELEVSTVLLITQVVSMILTFVFVVWNRRSRGAEKIALRFSFKGFDPMILLGGILMAISCSVVIEPLLSLLPSPMPMNASGWPLMIAVVVCAPLFEEILCRGFIFEAMRAKGGVIVAWLGSSLFFGLLHLDPVMVVYAFFLGLILCYIYIRSGSLIAPIIIHAFNNAVAYLFIVIGFGENVLLKDLIKNENIYYVVYGVAVLILIVSSVMCARQFKKIINAKKSTK